MKLKTKIQYPDFKKYASSENGNRILNKIIRKVENKRDRLMRKYSLIKEGRIVPSRDDDAFYKSFTVIPKKRKSRDLKLTLGGQDE